MGAPELLIVLGGLVFVGLTVPYVWAVIDITMRPAQAFEAVGRRKGAWLAAVLLLGAPAGITYLLLIRPKVSAAIHQISRPGSIRGAHSAVPSDQPALDPGPAMTTAPVQAPRTSNALLYGGVAAVVVLLGGGVAAMFLTRSSDAPDSGRATATLSPPTSAAPVAVTSASPTTTSLSLRATTTTRTLSVSQRTELKTTCQVSMAMMNRDASPCLALVELLTNEVEKEGCTYLQTTMYLSDFLTSLKAGGPLPERLGKGAC